MDVGELFSKLTGGGESRNRESELRKIIQEAEGALLAFSAGEQTVVATYEAGTNSTVDLSKFKDGAILRAQQSVRVPSGNEYTFYTWFVTKFLNNANSQNEEELVALHLVFDDPPPMPQHLSKNLHLKLMGKKWHLKRIYPSKAVFNPEDGLVIFGRGSESTKNSSMFEHRFDNFDLMQAGRSVRKPTSQAAPSTSGTLSVPGSLTPIPVPVK